MSPSSLRLHFKRLLACAGLTPDLVKGLRLGVPPGGRGNVVDADHREPRLRPARWALGVKQGDGNKGPGGLIHHLPAEAGERPQAKYLSLCKWVRSCSQQMQKLGENAFPNRHMVLLGQARWRPKGLKGMLDCRGCWPPCGARLLYLWKVTPGAENVCEARTSSSDRTCRTEDFWLPARLARPRCWPPCGARLLYLWKVTPGAEKVREALSTAGTRGVEFHDYYICLAHRLGLANIVSGMQHIG